MYMYNLSHTFKKYTCNVLLVFGNMYVHLYLSQSSFMATVPFIFFVVSHDFLRFIDLLFFVNLQQSVALRPGQFAYVTVQYSRAQHSICTYPFTLYSNETDLSLVACEITKGKIVCRIINLIWMPTDMSNVLMLNTAVCKCLSRAFPASPPPPSIFHSKTDTPVGW
jgi:hypothetical protein